MASDSPWTRERAVDPRVARALNTAEYKKKVLMP